MVSASGGPPGPRPAVMTEPYAERVRALLDQITEIKGEFYDSLTDEEQHASVGFVDYDDDTRWQLHAHACSLSDYTFWVREDPRHPGYWCATEVETGCSARGSSAQEAMTNYWDGHFDRPTIDREAE